MKRALQVVAIVALLLVMVAWVWPALRLSPAPPPLWPETTKAGPASVTFAGDWTGTASCSGRGCHGSIASPIDLKSTRILRDEFSKWLGQDKHAQAYEVLFNPLSQQIARHLGIPKANEDKRCLACHVLPDTTVADRSFGVGCEACHGSAAKWIEPHVTGKLSASEKRELGMVPVDDLPALARACAGCHVGAPPAAAEKTPRDVNHDLIAAGHPRLNFEFGSFLANLPPHWNTEFPKPKRDEIRAWGIGQVVSAEAALELLAFRAEPAHNNPWPEFAEYDCFACHHKLEGISWRQERAAPASGRPLGTLPWGTWYFWGPARLLDPANAEEARIAKSLSALRTAMERPLPGRVWSQARKAAAELEMILSRIEKGFDVGRLRSALQQPGSQIDRSWDAAQQCFLAACAWNDVRRDAIAQDSLRRIHSELLRPEGFRPGLLAELPKIFSTFKE